MSEPIALESLTQRGRTPLYNDLSRLIQESMDALSSEKYADSRLCVDGLYRFGFDKAMIKIIAKHTGFPISQVVIYAAPTPNAMATTSLTNRASATADSNRTTRGAILSKINSLYDDRTGILDSPESIKDVRFSLSITSTFWSLRDGDNRPVYSADEVAACLLHEIGHFDQAIRNEWRAYHQIQDAADIVSYIKASPDIDTVLKILDLIKKSPYISDEWFYIIRDCEIYFLSRPNHIDEQYLDTLTACCLIVEAELSLRVTPSLNLRGDPTTMKKQTVSYDIDKERLADDYASRNGAYSALVSLFGKLNNENDAARLAVLRQFCNSGISNIVMCYQKFFESFQIGIEDVSHGYDSRYRRMQLVIQTAKHAFEDSNLPKTVKVEIHSQIQQAETYLKDVMSSKRRQTRLNIRQWLDTVKKLKRLVMSPVIHRLSGDYFRLQNATRDLTRNPLHYLANKHNL